MPPVTPVFPDTVLLISVSVPEFQIPPAPQQSVTVFPDTALTAG
jgi:hypothetical protein